MQCHLAGTPETRGFQLGLSMRGSESLNGLRFDRQEVEETAESLRVATHLVHPQGFRLVHGLAWDQGDAFFTVRTECVNEGDRPLTLEYFPSCSLEELNLDRSWAGYGRRSKRFGQTGSMPVRGFFPWMAVEDAEAERSLPMVFTEKNSRKA